MISIDLDKGPIVVDARDYFDRIEIIPLESKDSAFLGQTSPSNFQYFEGKFYFLDRQDHRIRVFDQDGRHLETLNKYGRGPGEYFLEWRLQINPARRTLDVLTQQGRIYSYSLDAEGHPLTRKVDVSDQVVSSNSFIVLPSGDGYVLFGSSSTYALYLVDAVTSEVQPWDYQIPANARASTSYNPLYLNDGKLMYYEGHATGKLFVLNTDDRSMTPRLDWDFGKYNFAENKLQGNAGSLERIQAMDEMSNSMANPVINMYETDKFIFFRFFFRKNWNTAIYDKRQGKALYTQQTKSGTMFFIQTVIDNAAYVVSDPQHLSQLVDPSLLDPRSRDILANISEDNNYVIIKSTLK